MGVLELGARQQAATAKWAKWALGTAAAVLHPPSCNACVQKWMLMDH